MDNTATANTPANQVAIIQNSVEVLKTGGEVLIANQTRKEKALAVGRNILETIHTKGMDAETDERANKYLANVNAATKEMKDNRASVTQIMDQLKKMYTEVENELDVKKEGTIPAQIQAHRNQYAKHQAELAEQKRKEAERKAAKDKEAIDLKYTVENQFTNFYNDHLLAMKNKVQQAFNNITLDTYEAKKANLEKYAPVLDPATMEIFVPHIFPTYHTKDEVNAIIDPMLKEKFTGFTSNYTAELSMLISELIDKLPSKLAELQEQKRLADEQARLAEEARIAEQKRQAEIAKANAAEKERLEKEAAIAREQEAQRQEELRKQQEAAAEEQRKREEAEKERMAKEAEEAKAKAEQEAAIQKQGEETMVMFEKEAALSDNENAPEARQGYEIEVLHPVGFTQIFALWFEKQGKDLPVDKIGNTKLDQMKAWAEKEAHKSGTKIESKFLKYNETFKAVNRKAKA